MPAQYWRITSGSDGRDYSKYFLKYGIAFVGGDNQTQTMEHVEEGDIVVLTSGNTIKAVGRVTRVGDKAKEWLKDFDGWILSSYCHVDWKIPTEEISIYRGRTIHKIHKTDVINIADIILNTTGTEKRPCEEPQDVRKVEVDEILNFLKDEMKTTSEDDLKNAISRIQSLAEHYYNNQRWRNIREHEARTFLVIPLLLALGWREQQIKIELPCTGGKVDIACFREDYNGQKDVDECVAIIETKSFHIGLDYAIGQINDYVKADREYFRNCKTAIVTNGHCYKVHLRNGDKSKEDPAAYMNIREPKNNYPLDPENVKGTLEAIRWLSPKAYL